MKPLTVLNGALNRALNSVNRARNDVGTLNLHTSPADPDIHDRISDAYTHLTRAEGLLEALRDDLAVWIKEDDHA